MLDAPVPSWKKWVMLAMAISFAIMLAIVVHQRRSARVWKHPPINPVASRPAGMQ